MLVDGNWPEVVDKYRWDRNDLSLQCLVCIQKWIKSLTLIIKQRKQSRD